MDDFRALDRTSDHFAQDHVLPEGVRYLAWHVLPTSRDVVVEALAFTEACGDLDAVAPVAPRWLHLTTQGVGAAPDVSPEEAQAVADSGRAWLADVEPFTATLGPPVPDPQGTGLPAGPRERFDELHAAVHAATRDAIGDRTPGSRFFDGPEPHVTLGYHRLEVPTGPIADRVEPLTRRPPVTFEVDRIDLLWLRRDGPAYVWDGVATVLLGC